MHHAADCAVRAVRSISPVGLVRLVPVLSILGLVRLVTGLFPSLSLQAVSLAMFADASRSKYGLLGL